MKTMTIQQALNYSGMSIWSLCLAVKNGDIRLITHDNKPIVSKVITEKDFQEGNLLYGASVDFDSLDLYMKTTVSILKVTEDNGKIRTIATQQIHDTPPYIREMPQKKFIEPTALIAKKENTKQKKRAGRKPDTKRRDATAAACKELFTELEQDIYLTQQDITKPAIMKKLKKRLDVDFHGEEFKKQWDNHRPEELKKIKGRPRDE